MPDSPLALADRLHQEGGRVVDFFNQLRPSQWEILIYPEPSKWNFHDLLAHFVSSEIGRRMLISDICDGGSGAPPDFDIDLYNQTELEKLSGHSNSKLVNLFTVERQKLVELVSSLSFQDLEKTGNDPFLGCVAVSEMIKLTYRHLQIHLREVRRYIV